MTRGAAAIREAPLHPASAAAAAVVVRAALTVWWGTLSAPRTFETEQLVRNMLAGRGFMYRFLDADQYSLYGAVPYALLYAAVDWLSGESRAANLVVQWVFAALLCVLVWHIGMRLGGRTVAGIAAWLAAMHPGLLVYDATRLIQFSFDGTLVAAGILAFVRWAECPSAGRAACAGLVSGLLMYERGTMGLFFPVALAWVQGTVRLSWSRWVRQVAVYGVAAALLVLPWMVRNAVVQRRLVPLMSTYTWLALWQGNNETATGTEFTADGQGMKRTFPAELSRRIQGKGELEQAEAFRDAALTFIRTHPGRAAELYVRKLGYFWWRSPHTGRWYPDAWLVLYGVWYVVFIACAMLGLVTLARGDPGPWAVGRLILWLAVCSSVGQAVFYVASRHRWTIEPVLGLLSAAGLQWLWQRRGATGAGAWWRVSSGVGRSR
jgi:hypothetical protein